MGGVQDYYEHIHAHKHVIVKWWPWMQVRVQPMTVMGCYLLFVGVWGCSECRISSAEACISIWSQRECFKHSWVRNCEMKILLTSIDCSILSCLARTLPSSFISWIKTDNLIVVALCIDIRVLLGISTSISRVALFPASSSSPYGMRWNTSRGFAPPHPASSSSFLLQVMHFCSLWS